MAVKKHGIIVEMPIEARQAEGGWSVVALPSRSLGSFGSYSFGSKRPRGAQGNNSRPDMLAKRVAAPDPRHVPTASVSPRWGRFFVQIAPEPASHPDIGLSQ
jgi:hypothetical protein